MSTDSIEIYKAVLALQSELKPVEKDQRNPHFGSKYSSLTAVWAEVQPLLAKNKLCLIQRLDVVEGRQFLITQLAHESGATIDSTCLLNPVKNEPQGMGSALSYWRRYSICALLGVVTDDDDGNDASAGQAPQKKAWNPPAKKEYTGTSQLKAPTEPQLKRLFAICNANGWSQQDLKDFLHAEYGVESTKQLTMDQYNATCAAIENGGELK